MRLTLSDEGAGLSDIVLEEANDAENPGLHLGLGLSLCKEIAHTSNLELQFKNKSAASGQRSGTGLEISVIINTEFGFRKPLL